ncbi:DUF5686 family protein [Balneola sp. MJW-20]|uniref:DUF5686 family protein n=1 Tax=Gracilimonas aurantiaca TaxID=3234185 RepID=UPI00346697DF
MTYIFRFLLLIFLMMPAGLSAQKVIRGTITDAETGEGLPNANILVEGTYRGTITNLDGEYTLTVPDIPATVLVRYIGYNSERREIRQNSDEKQDFALQPAIFDLGEVVVTGEDKAIRIMREVIRRKQIWRASLNTYRAEAYTRQRLANDTSIVSISESISEAFWDKEKGHREVVKSRRQTANIEGSDNFAGVSYLPNFYDDNLDIAGFDVVGVTNPKAFDYYDFKILSETRLDDKIVYEIGVSAKRKLQPTFEGTIFVLDEDFALLSVDLKPNDVVTFPVPIQDFDLSYEQQFNNFGGDYWLPVDVRINGTVRVGLIGLRFPPINFSQIARISNYQVNVPLPDSLYENYNTMRVDSVTIRSDSLFRKSVDVIPLSEIEVKAYETIDSTTTLEDAFRPTGFLARFIDFDDEDENNDGYTVGSGDNTTKPDSASTGKNDKKGSNIFKALRKGFKLDGRFNRVDLLYAGGRYNLYTKGQKVRFNIFGGYSFGYEEAGYGGSVSVWPLKGSSRLVLSAGYSAATDSRYKTTLYPEVLTSALNVLGVPDYHDYYRNEKITLAAGYRFRKPNMIGRIYLRSEEHSSIEYYSSYSPLALGLNRRPNPTIDEGYVRSVTLSLDNLSGDEKALGIIGNNSFILSAEFSDGALGSDYDFARFNLEVYRQFNTIFKRRLFPNTLDLRLMAGTSIGDLPYQRYGILDGTASYFTPFGSFRTQRNLPLEGEHYLGLVAEHNFRTVPFEILGLDILVDQGVGLVVFGGAGRTWIDEDRKQQFLDTNGYNLRQEDLIAEIGVSVNSIFSVFRVDLAQRLDEPGFFVGLSLARWF